MPMVPTRNVFSSAAVVAPPVSGFSELVAPTGGDYSTIQAAIDDNLKTFEVKGGETYTENLTFDEACQSMIVHPGATISGTITVSVDDVSIELMTGCTVTGQINWNGANGSIECENGCNFDAQIILSGTLADSFSFNGGGFGTLCEDLINVADGNAIVQSASIDSKTGATTRSAIAVGSDTNIILTNLNIINSDDIGLAGATAASDHIFSFNTVQNADSVGCFVAGTRLIAIGNLIKAVSGDGIEIDLTGDDSVVGSNIVDDSVVIDSGAADTQVYGNRVDTTLTDSDGTGTVSGNDTTAF